MGILDEYVSDLKRCCSRTKKAADEAIKDPNFKDSNIQKEDFFIYRIKEFLRNECKQEKVDVKDLVDIKCGATHLSEIDQEIAAMESNKASKKPLKKVTKKDEEIEMG